MREGGHTIQGLPPEALTISDWQAKDAIDEILRDNDRRKQAAKHEAKRAGDMAYARQQKVGEKRVDVSDTNDTWRQKGVCATLPGGHQGYPFYPKDESEKFSESKEE